MSKDDYQEWLGQAEDAELSAQDRMRNFYLRQVKNRLGAERLRGADSGPKTGFICEVCKDYNEYATANQPNGTYICYEHRT